LYTCLHCHVKAPGHTIIYCPQHPCAPSSAEFANGTRKNSELTNKKESESRWGSWDAKKINDETWLEWKEEKLKEKLKRDGWNPITNIDKSQWMSPTETEKKKKRDK
jgi:hypothetical protein